MPTHRSTTTPNRIITSPAARRYIYQVFLAAGPVATFYGFASHNELALWGGLLQTVLGLPVGLALANVPKP